MKKVLAFLLAAAMVLSLAACGSQTDSSSNAPAAPKELRFVTGLWKQISSPHDEAPGKISFKKQ